MGLTIAVDFDGTIVEHAYPEIGEEMLYAFMTLKELQKRGHRLILWTYREGERLEEAVEYCKDNGVKFYAVNESFPGERRGSNDYSRKLNAELFIDDRNIGGFLGWSEIFQMIHPEGGQLNLQVKNKEAHGNHGKKKGFFQKLFGG